MVKFILDQNVLLSVVIILVVLLAMTLGQMMPCKPDHYITDVDTTTCRSCQKDVSESYSQGQCSSDKILINISLCNVCCAKCQPCETCGLGRFLYHDFEGRACSWNSNVICCEERNMDEVNDVCVHRTTTVKMTTVQTTSVISTKSVDPLVPFLQARRTSEDLSNCSPVVKQCTAFLTISIMALLKSSR